MNTMYKNETNVNFITLNELAIKPDLLDKSEFEIKYWFLLESLESVLGLKDNSPIYDVYSDYKIMWVEANTPFYVDESVSEYALSSIKTASKL